MSKTGLAETIRIIPDFPKEGIQFFDLTPVFQRADLMRTMVVDFSAFCKDKQIDAVLGIESRGFFLAPAIALNLDLPFVPLRKPGKLPYKTVSQSYQLEYGMDSLEMHVDALRPGQRVMIHDDVLATGGTAQAAANLVKHLGAEVVAFTFIIELNALGGRSKIEPCPTLSLLNYN